jgi:hypothetical protein
MSADNILVILRNKDKISVYDTAFSFIGSLEAWDFPLTAENSKTLTDRLIGERYSRPTHTCDTIEQAEEFCQQYVKDNLVEYGHTSIIA